MVDKKDPIADGIKTGRIYGMKCEALKTSPSNLKYCPDREECKVLSEHMEWVNEMEEILRELNCGFCESKLWYFVGITKDGTMVTATTTEEYAKELNILIDKTRKGGSTKNTSKWLKYY